MFFRSERLFLRPGFPEDWQDILAGIGDEGVVRHLSRAPWPYGEDDARAFTARAQDPRLPHFLVTLPGETGAPVIGVASLADNGAIDEFGGPELGYWIARRYWGNGYATEAGRAVVRLAGLIGHKRIVASHYLDNPASGRVLRKLGFRPTGAVRTQFSLGRGAEAQAAVLEREEGDGDNICPSPRVKMGKQARSSAKSSQPKAA
jgi:RimJ/RimL family protein N-acetyltransferase